MPGLLSKLGRKRHGAPTTNSKRHIPSTTLTIPKTRYEAYRSQAQEDSGKENVAPDDEGFTLSKHEQKKLEKKHEEQEELDARAWMAKVKGGYRHPDPNLGRQKTRKAKAIIAEADAKRVKKNQTRTQVQRDDQYRRRVGGTTIGRHRTATIIITSTLLHGIPFLSQIPGLIIWHKDTKPLPPNSSKKLGDPGVWAHPLTGTIFETKGRYWIIFAHHYRGTEQVKILTRGGKGMDGIPEQEFMEYLNLQPFGMSDEKYKKQNPGTPTLKIAGEMGRRRMNRAEMVVRISQKVRFDFAIDELEVVGALTQESLDVLVESIKSLEGRNSLDEEEEEEED